MQKLTSTTRGKMDESMKLVSDDFAQQLSPETALPVAAIMTLIGVIRRSTNTTIRGMEAELKEAIQLMEDKMETDNPENRSAISYQRHAAVLVHIEQGHATFMTGCSGLGLLTFVVASARRSPLWLCRGLCCGLVPTRTLLRDGTKPR